jgi:hypothetical protein
MSTNVVSIAIYSDSLCELSSSLGLAVLLLYGLEIISLRAGTRSLPRDQVTAKTAKIWNNL